MRTRSTAALASELRLMGRALIALLAPESLSEPLAQADHAVSISRNEPLRQSPPDKQLEHLQSLRGATAKRLKLLRRRLVTSAVSMASAAAAAVISRSLPLPRPPGSALAVGSLFCFATATLGRLGWAGQSIRGETSPERLDQLIFHVLYWLGMYLGTAAVY